MAYAGVEIWSHQTGHKSMTFMVRPENLKEVSLTIPVLSSQIHG